MTWFEALTGFPEKSPDYVRDHITVHGDTWTSLVNHRTFTYGRLETPSLGELRRRVARSPHETGSLSLREVVADVSDLHADESNAGALFQVASQFNLLEMVGPSVTPEQGVGIYEHDRSQGPACAIACGAGTIYRNYFVPVDGQPGQTATRQIDCLVGIGKALGNEHRQLWKMRNGYALPNRQGLLEISGRLQVFSDSERDRLRRRLRIGVQWDTQVTIRGSSHTVTQAYCSALPVAYGGHPAHLWEDFARLILEASYETTLCAAILNASASGNDQVFLTLLGGGAFGNRTEWIIESIERALHRYPDWPLDVAIVSYGASKPHVRRLVERFPRS